MTLNSTQAKEIYENCELAVYPHSIDIVVDQADGFFVWDLDGRKYLDFAAGIGVNILGYNHPKIQKIAHEQIDKIVHTSNLFYNPVRAALMQKLTDMTGLERCFFSNSGAEANEAAIKIARRWGNSINPKKHKIICFETGWHGRTIATISASMDLQARQGFEPLLEGFDYVEAFNIEQIKQKINQETCAVLIEPILGHGGIHCAPIGFLKELRQLCDQHQVALILDEIQSGLGRSGKFFCYDHSEIKPDIVTLAKGIANGFPLGVTLASDKLAKTMSAGSHGSTFGGNTLSCAVALEVLDIVTEKLFLDSVTKHAQLFKQKLELLQSEFPNLIAAVRSFGLIAAIDFKLDKSKTLKAIYQSGLICTAVGNHCIRFTPALNIGVEEIEQAYLCLKKACHSLEI